MTQLVAIDYDSGKALFRANENLSVVVDINKRDVDTALDAVAAAAWLKVAPDLEYPSVWRELADAAVTKLEVEKTEAPPVERKFRIPHAVKAEVELGTGWVKGFERGGTPVATAIAKTLSEETYLPLSKVQRIARYFARRPESITENAGWSPGSMGFPTDDRIKYSLWGGQAAREWITKIDKKHPLLATGVPTPEVVKNNPEIIAEVKDAPDTDGDVDVDPDEPHEFVLDPETADQCLVCGLFQDDEIHVGLVAGAFERNPDAEYFGKGEDPDSTYVTELYMLQPDNTWKLYDGTGWVDMNPPAEDAVIIMLDPESAQILADFIELRDPDSQERGIELSTLNPMEAALFSAAEAEIDWGLVDAVFDIYDSTERSVNAKKQVRGPGGKFGDMPDAPEAEKTTEQPTKARLPQPLPLVTDVAARIDQYLADVAKARGGQNAPAPAQEVPTPSGGDAEQASAIDAINHLIEQGGQNFAEGDPAAVTDVRPLYLAIVDAVDTEAVLDLVAVVPPAAGTQGDVTVWKRHDGRWIQAPDLLADLRGTSPPPVVELTDDGILTEVISQVDKATSADNEEPMNEAPTSPAPAKPDANPDQHPIPAQASAVEFGDKSPEKRDKLAKKGYALPDGSYPIETVADLKNAVQAFGRAKNKTLARQHIIKRARALNRTDLLPKDWNKNERENGYTMWGPHGEILSLVAAEGGADKNRGNAERLRRYWLKGEGAAKIGWNTPGDWYRCVAHLTKYLGTRSRGYCTLRHKDATGHWPGDKENH